MKVEIRAGTARGTIKAPPSKSMAHRLLICAGFAEGESVIRGVDPSEDVLATMDCLRALHVDCDADTLLATVEQEGAACHTGNHSCFYNNNS